MAAVNITIDPAVMMDGSGNVVATGKIVGQASLTGLGVGGGPIIPPGQPPVIWPGPGPLPHPEHPIVIPGGKPEVPPPSIWPPGPGIDFPSHPIVLPPPVGGGPPEMPPGTNLITWKAVWVPPAVTGGDGSWMILGTPSGPHPSPS